MAPSFSRVKSSEAGSSIIYYYTQSVRIYLKQGESLEVNFGDPAAYELASTYVSVSGYWVDVP